MNIQQHFETRDPFIPFDTGYRPVPADATPEAIEQQVGEFLRKGGSITYLPPCAFSRCATERQDIGAWKI